METWARALASTLGEEAMPTEWTDWTNADGADTREVSTRRDDWTLVGRDDKADTDDLALTSARETSVESGTAPDEAQEEVDRVTWDNPVETGTFWSLVSWPVARQMEAAPVAWTMTRQSSDREAADCTA